jgi:sugar/nucleoside kinase (ribokinase family)
MSDANLVSSPENDHAAQASSIMLAMPARTQVFGPAYLDRVVRVDRPLVDPERSAPLDQSVDGSWKFGKGHGLTIVDPEGSSIAVSPPADWPGPSGEVTLSRRLGDEPPGWSRTVSPLSWHDDLGGMGAGYASAFGGELVSALGPAADPMSAAITDLLTQAGILHRPIRVDHPADWTLLLTSGPFGDKLPIGFRGCHASLASLGATPEPVDLRVVASHPNRLAAEALRAPGARVRFFAPASRNMTDRDLPVTRFADAIDILCCNRREWETLEGREEVAWQVSILAVTDGANGSVVRYMTPEGEAGRLVVSAFPRANPPKDTNRAGEAYASTLVTSLLEGGWTPGASDPALDQSAGLRASAAAALVLDRVEFGFPSRGEIEAALQRGSIA